MKNYLREKEQNLLNKAKRSVCAYYCSRCGRQINPYTLEGAGIIRPEDESDIMVPAKPMPRMNPWLMYK